MSSANWFYEWNSTIDEINEPKQMPAAMFDFQVGAYGWFIEKLPICKPSRLKTKRAWNVTDSKIESHFNATEIVQSINIFASG